MLLMIEEGIRGGICQPVHRFTKTNNKYMKNYNVLRCEQFVWMGNVQKITCW